MDALLIDLSTETVLHHVTTTGYQPSSFGVDLLDGHLYRWIASGVSLSPPAGDPCAHFSFRFYDTLTGAGADFAAVPEPSALVLFGSGIAAWILRRRASKGRV
ncbi:MAG: PEP-CTERM sorting domain-containing protein [Acidobacteria bacterium]|nr:PEP-CTERM sorting domain-containing protein [Acidobacteriota bacterium]